MGNTDEWLLDNYDERSLNDECREEMRAAKAMLSQPAVKTLSTIERQQQIKAEQYDIFCIHDYSELRNGNLQAAENVFKRQRT